jgi:hypothetical protein
MPCPCRAVNIEGACAKSAHDAYDILPHFAIESSKISFTKSAAAVDRTGCELWIAESLATITVSMSKNLGPNAFYATKFSAIKSASAADGSVLAAVVVFIASIAFAVEILPAK